jgi:NADH-quinone oxidoreductase subunit L
VEWAWLAPALSASAFLAIVLFGRVLPREGAWLAPLAIAGGFGVFWGVLLRWIEAGGGSHAFAFTWLQAGDVRIPWGMLLDPLSLVLMGLVTFVALLVQVYSWGYMAREPRFGWYFAAHALFAASMLTLVLADNLLLLYIAWELVGLCSYLLIGFWYERRPAAEAAKKAFITTRLGDVGMLIGILLLFRQTGTFQIQEVFAHVEAGRLSPAVVTAAALLLFTGAMGKSAQFPFHVWLPDAMEGPTPVSALIHAATMVAAGVYLVARMFPLFEASGVALLVVASIAILTALLAAGMALVMTDVKRVLAYSTITDLALMMLALGAGSIGAAIFHLVVHGFAKALLFLGAGSVSHGTGRTDIRDLGGIASAMPLTTLTFLVGAFSLGGIPPLGGWFSKDKILVAVGHGLGGVFLALAMVVAFLKALYMGRLLWTVFFGKATGVHAHESPPVMTGPLVILAGGALAGGVLAFPWGEAYGGFGAFLAPHKGKPFHLEVGVAAPSTVLAVGGFALTWLAYHAGRLSPEAIRRRWGWLHHLLARKYYLDDLYQWCVDHIVLAMGQAIALFDRLVVNDTGVDGTGRSVVLAGRGLRLHVTGLVYTYALGIVAGFLTVALVWWLVLGRL